MPQDKLLTYQDLAGLLQVQSTKTVAKLLKECQRFNPTRNTVRFLERDVWKFIEDARSAKADAKPDRSPGAKPDRVKRTKRPDSASK
jgi:hypothetical protein